jgi:hypothetical protein
MLIQILGILVVIVLALWYVYGNEIFTKTKEWFNKTFVDVLYKKKESVKENVKQTVRETITEKINEARYGGKTKSKVGEKITDWERNFLWNSIKNRKRVRCINCESEDMYEGPQGGMSTNWRCPNCGQGINLTFFANNKDGFMCDNIGIDKSWIGR